MAWSLCVYCGSRDGDAPAFRKAAHRLGEALAQSGGRLVYGGGKAGLMGVVADAVLGAGGEVVGVIPQALMDREVGHRGVTELHVVQTMHERKTMMAERADAFLALPGGIGTMEELFEVWSWHQLGYHDKPVGLLDVDGYYADLIAFLHAAQRRGFVSERQLGALHVDTDIDALLERLRDAAARADAPDDYREI